MCKYKVGQIVKFDEGGLDGFGIIVKINNYTNDYSCLIRLLGGLSNSGHEADGFDGNYDSRCYWWVHDYGIEYGVIGNRLPN